MVLTAVTQSFQSYALRMVQDTLRRISAPVKLTDHVGEEEEVLYDDPMIADSEKAIVCVKDVNFWKRAFLDFDLGFAESYMFQEIECDNLSKIFDLYIQNRATLDSGGSPFHLIVRLAQWWLPKNNIENSRSNIASHYDTSNGLFTNFLSPDLNYSCAHFTSNAAETLQTAQRRKVHYMIKKARLQSTHHLLDIGCGWGDLIIEAARLTGCKATGITLSEEQKSLADERIREAGLQDRIRVLLCDYRNAPRPERMFEHVGAEYMDQYFEVISQLLPPEDGVLVIDGITKIQPFHETNPRMGEYIDRYVFPGGYLPTPNILFDSLHRGSKGSLEVTSVLSSGPHYGKTLLGWRDNFLANWEDIRSDFCSRHPEASAQDYYFEYCEAGFRNRILGNYTICAVRAPERLLVPNKTKTKSLLVLLYGGVEGLCCELPPSILVQITANLAGS
ncbi:2-heptaprenyl-1,4-naphthoquinone methyltransferase [Aspergillus neoniger CBS 115656]|uniref:2-heptaprenyl-1,4-naphthoquinone methyltransferase n=1 Tax=Aspergillus neoniger (strain CBS 115656) TaxID=1448310 RepID=A0A318YCM9_ASPNB|nr:2-heptaprenyl-1,4-naphthoquinone methyltransferase [Aspergillus neoniger CBS 115656]PYH30430.1 2-heptaprenyl-1,4-naphthoquinone methyltransferase [Aspergillus neoniger CBS 115656]